MIVPFVRPPTGEQFWSTHGDTQRSGCCEIEDPPQVRRGHRGIERLICSASYSASSPTPLRCADLNLWSQGSPRKYTPGTPVTPRLCRVFAPPLSRCERSEDQSN